MRGRELPPGGRAAAVAPDGGPNGNRECRVSQGAPPMASAEHLTRLREGVAVWNLWRTQNPNVNVDLQDAILPKHDFNKIDLHRANLSNANLVDTYLREADLTAAWMSGAQLQDADLTQAKLAGSRMIGASLRQTTLRDADLRNADLSHTDLTDTDFSGADLSGASLYQAILVGTNLQGANLTGCSVYGVSTWDPKLEGAIQSNLVITRPLESPIQVDDVEIAQFVYLLLRSAKLRDVIDTIGKKAVLILGRFTAERKPVLDAIRDRLRQRGYLPILFDFDKPMYLETRTKRSSRWQDWLDSSLRTSPIRNLFRNKPVPIVPNLPSVPVQPILQDGYEPWGMGRSHTSLPLGLAGVSLRERTGVVGQPANRSHRSGRRPGETRDAAVAARQSCQARWSAIRSSSRPRK